MSKISVLIVDDASFIRDLMKKCLRDNFPGIALDEATNGRKAQQMLTRQSFDLILCDWEMPEMSGIELLQWCRAQDSLKATPIIMVTSRGDKENVVQAIQAGISDYVGKPFTNEQLITKVKKALHKVGKLQALIAGGIAKPLGNSAFANDSLSALTGGNPNQVKPASPASAAPARAPQPAPASPRPVAMPSGRGQAQLRLPNGAMTCVIKALSLRDAQIVVKRAELLPQILESAVLDLEQGDDGGGSEVARLNGYLHSIAALEQKPDSEWLQVVFRFVDQDAQKMDYLSRLIARGTAQKHFTPGA
ncbi:response regulator [Pseudomonas matsuisoli]|uniref:Two-component system response regulator n=1 Tax=Pseudomonas matsuisoli TaxID=1515666 RepID=A0A917PVW0_9PSED|nr:response regulator [Pseudomonas matsuisoli]GGJ94338.1 two-component system response regulator [Pseudomonas matsuisoli]